MIYMIQEKLKPKPILKPNLKENKTVKTLQSINTNSPNTNESRRSIKQDFINMKQAAKMKAKNIASPSLFKKMKNKLTNTTNLFFKNIGRFFSGLRYPYFRGKTGKNKNLKQI